MANPVVLVAAGLYYTLGSLLLYKKLTGDECDWVIPTTRDRPTIDNTNGYGLLGFSSGLYVLQKIPDSNAAFSHPERDAWSIKIPWEVHLRRKRPPEELYDPMHPYWTEQAILARDQLLALAEEQNLAELNPEVTIPDDIDSFRLPPLRRDVEFEVRGEWFDQNTGFDIAAPLFSPATIEPFATTGERVLRFALGFRAEDSFDEVTLGEMSRRNKGQPCELTLKDGDNLLATPRKHTPGETPAFFDAVFNTKAGVTHDWHLTFKKVHVHPVGIEQFELARWFDYEEPEKVRFRFKPGSAPEPLFQVLNYEW